MNKINKEELEVKKWFEIAEENKFGAHINLYYERKRKIFFKLARPVIYKGADLSKQIGMHEYDNKLFEIRSGPGDCEERLVFVSKLKGK